MEISSKEQATKRESWFKIIEDFNNSGLSQVGYCRQHNINKDHFAYYLSRWRLKHSSTSNSVSFIEMQIDENAKDTRWILNVANGMSLEVPSGIGLQHLAELIIKLRTASCL